MPEENIVSKEEVKEKELVLQIRILPNADIKIDGNVLNNEIMALYMLEKAKDLIKVHCAELARNVIQKPRGGILNFVRNRKV